MLKGIAGSLILASGYVLALGTMVQLEQQRSLGNGRLAGYLDSHDRQVALRAELAVGRTKQQAGAVLLLKRSSNPDAGMRAMAVYGLGLIGSPQGAPAVLRALGETNDVVRVAALDATDRLETAHVLDPGQERKARIRVAALLQASDATVRGRAGVTLESFATGAQGPVAQNALQSAFATERDGGVREHIAWALYRGYAKSAALATLRRELRDADDVVRIEGVRALGKRGDRAQLALLTPLANDPSWRVQEQALESMKVLKGGKMTEHLKSIANGIHVPARAADPWAGIKALPRTRHKGKYAPPDPHKVITAPALDASTVALFTGPQAGPHPRMRIVTTQGNIYLELFPEWAPLTVENFMNLASGGYYDGNPWFRIVPDFVVQSGDPSATSPGVGYTTVAEENPVEQNSYIVALGLDYTNPPNAHAKRDSAGSEFYITLSPQFHLNRDFSVFGRVVRGFDVLGRLVESDKILRIERLPDLVL